MKENKLKEVNFENLKDFSFSELRDEIENRGGYAFKDKDEKQENNFGWGMVGFMIGLIFVAIAWAIFLGEEFSIDKTTLDEVCTQLSGQPSVFNIEETTDKVIVCNPMAKKDEIVLDEGKIILKNYDFGGD